MALSANRGNADVNVTVNYKLNNIDNAKADTEAFARIQNEFNKKIAETNSHLEKNQRVSRAVGRSQVKLQDGSQALVTVTRNLATEQKKQAGVMGLLKESHERLLPVTARVLDAMIAYKAIIFIEQTFNKIADATFGMAIELDKARSRIRGVTGDAVFAEIAFQRLSDVTGRLPVQFGELSKGSQLMIARGLAPTTRSLTALIATARATDKPLENIIDQVGRITLTTGTESRGLKQLGIGFAAFAKELEKVEDRETALVNLLERNFGRVLDDRNQSLGDLVTRLNETIGIVSQPITMPIVDDMKSAAIEMLKALDRLREFTSSDSGKRSLGFGKKGFRNAVFNAIPGFSLFSAISDFLSTNKSPNPVELFDILNEQDKTTDAEANLKRRAKIESEIESLIELSTKQERQLRIEKAKILIHGESELSILEKELKLTQERLENFDDIFMRAEEIGATEGIIEKIQLNQASLLEKIYSIKQKIQRINEKIASDQEKERDDELREWLRQRALLRSEELRRLEREKRINALFRERRFFKFTASDLAGGPDTRDEGIFDFIRRQFADQVSSGLSAAGALEGGINRTFNIIQSTRERNRSIDRQIESLKRELDIQNGLIQPLTQQEQIQLRIAELQGQQVSLARAFGDAMVRELERIAAKAFALSAVFGIARLFTAAPFGGIGLGGLLSRGFGFAGPNANGFSGVVTKPTLFSAAEDGRPERVEITPQGKSSSGVHFHFHEPVVGIRHFRDLVHETQRTIARDGRR